MRTQVREEVRITAGRIIVQGNLNTRGKKKRADYILYYKSDIPIAIIEAKDNNHNVGDGMQQALEYSEILHIPFVFTSNGDSFLFHDKTKNTGDIEKEISLDEFPSPEQLWNKSLQEEVETPESRAIVEQEYHKDDSDMSPRYYQQNTINRTIDAVKKARQNYLSNGNRNRQDLYSF